MAEATTAAVYEVSQQSETSTMHILLPTGSNVKKEEAVLSYYLANNKNKFISQ